jgi:hypothetical protein
MGGKRKPRGKPARKRVKPRNPLAPVVRAKRAVVEPSKRAYTRKPKHRKPETESGGDLDA